MERRIATLAAAALLVCTSGVVHAQARSDLLVAGAHIRFHTRTSSSWNGGRIDSVSADSVFVATNTWGTTPRGVARGDFTRLDVSTGRSSRVADTFQGLGAGLVLGVLTGVIVGSRSGTTHNCWDICTPSQKAELWGLVGAVSGGLVGGIVGVLRAPSEHWTTVIPPTTAPIRR